MYVGVLCSFYYCAIQTLEEICTSIIDRYLLNIHQQIQYIKEIGAIYIADNACRHYCITKSLLNSPPRSPFSRILFNHLPNFWCPVLLGICLVFHWLRSLVYSFVSLYVKASRTSHRPVASANIAQTTFSVTSNILLLESANALLVASKFYWSLT